ncbi:hypothetical protein H4CHR_00442 [Variovorax sp. PBS-H4]|uniref:hypothetical protein n=1 Tax=Variovorax sp. PBS-H4 TaxID=434008 RepID=UPI001317A89B|nr:hypothetical protein [Variovorax sp. PBS-H4]VTU19724.1 hypothetical protein H4CHR_00442 [Variovorax sp. PBS-H4]
MMRLFLVLALALACLAARADEAEQPLPTLPPDQEAAAVQSAEVMGKAVFQHERAIATATDAVLKTPAFRNDTRVRGWITEEHDGLITVTFVDRRPAALYRVAVSTEDDKVRELTTLDQPSPLSPFEAGAAAARELAVGSGFQPCAEQYNTVVLPADASQVPHRWVVYLLPVASGNQTVPLGGTYRVITEGASVIAQRAFTRSCLTLRQDRRAAGLYVTHVLDNIPTDAHVFWSLWAREPMFVGTPDGRVWAVKQGKITQGQRRAAS